MKFTSGIFLVLFMSLTFIPGCKKDIASNALLVLDIHSIFSGDSVMLGTTYKSSLGRNFSFSRINYYISDIQLTATNNTTQSVSGTLLISPQTEQYVAGAVPPGSYKSISFVVGIDSTADYIDPSNYSGNNPLAAQTPSMHFSTDSLGYIFLAVEGLYDSSTTGTGTPNSVFSYHVGTGSFLEGVNMPDHSVAPYNAVFTAAAGQLLTVHLEANLSVLLNNIDVKNNPVTNTTDYPIVADSLASHIPGMFVYQQ